MAALQGYRTYISAGIIAAAAIAHSFGWIDDQTYQTLLGLAGAGGLAALRMGIVSTAETTAKGQAVIAEQVGVRPDVIATKIAPPVDTKG